MSLPNTYTQLNYIESAVTTNNRPCIDTGVNGGSSVKYELKFLPYWITSPSAYAAYFCGADKSTWPKIIQAGSGTAYRNKIQIESRPSSTSSTTTKGFYSGLIGNDCIISFEGDTVSIDSVKDTSINYYNNGWGSDNVYIFNRADGTRPSSMRFYYLKMWTDNVLVRDFIPAERKSDNEIGVYDLVNDVFYTNAGTGEFISGGPYIIRCVNKVIYNSNGVQETLIDLTSDTVTEETLVSGYTAHKQDGSIITGTFIEGKPIEVNDETSMNALLVSTNAGKSYLYVGTTTATYTNGNLYTVEVS